MTPRQLRLTAVMILLAALLWGKLLAISQGQRPLVVALSPASLGPGDVVRITVGGTLGDKLTATAFGQNLTFAFEDRRGDWVALAGVDLETKPGSYDLRIQRDVEEVATRTIQILPRQFRTRRLRVQEGFVNPSPEALAQIETDNKTLAETYALATPRRWTGSFVPPVEGTPTSNFGTRSFYNGSPRAPHAGIDFMSAPGTPIHAPNHGSVALASPLYFTGNTVVVDHGAGLISVFAHLSEFRVTTGEIVTPGTIVGLVGATGRVTGPHLHWSVRLNKARVDPQSLIAATRMP